MTKKREDFEYSIFMIRENRNRKLHILKYSHIRIWHWNLQLKTGIESNI